MKMKNTFTSCVAIACLFGNVHSNQVYETNYDVSRSSKTVKHIFSISAQGSHTPVKSLNWAEDPKEEPSQLNYVTPLGIRQQYMIGNELRLRYVEEQPSFLDDIYNIT